MPQERRAHSEARRLLAAALERIPPQLEAAGAPESIVEEPERPSPGPVPEALMRAWRDPGGGGCSEDNDSMRDPWEVLDIIANLIEVGGLVYVIYRNRGWLTRRSHQLRVLVTDRLGVSDSSTQILTGGGIESLASIGGGTLVGTAKGKSSASGQLLVTCPPQ